jgi:hypothetical protein
MAEINLLCPHCTQPLEADDEIVGLEINCPVCNGPFVVSAQPEDEAALLEVADEPAPAAHVKVWEVDVRILARGTPPIFFKTLVEVPEHRSLPDNGMPPPDLVASVAHAVHIRYPESPVTPIRVHAPDMHTLTRCNDKPDYIDAACRVWLLGKRTNAS